MVLSVSLLCNVSPKFPDIQVFWLVACNFFKAESEKRAGVFHMVGWGIDFSFISYLVFF